MQPGGYCSSYLPIKLKQLNLAQNEGTTVHTRHTNTHNIFTFVYNSVRFVSPNKLTRDTVARKTVEMVSGKTQVRMQGREYGKS